MTSQCYQNKCKRDRVQDEMGRLVVRVEAGEEEENDRDDCQELPGWRVLQTVVQLLPMSQQTYRTWNKKELLIWKLLVRFTSMHFLKINVLIHLSVEIHLSISIHCGTEALLSIDWESDDITIGNCINLTRTANFFLFWSHEIHMNSL